MHNRLNKQNKAFHLVVKRFVILMGVTLSLATCTTNEVAEVKEMEAKENAGKEEFGTEVEILITKKGKANIKITAPVAVRNYGTKPFTEFPEGMTLEVYNQQGEQESTLRANYGKMGDGSTQMTAKDSVVVVNKTGEVLNTEHLIWDKEQSIIKTEGFVKIHTADEIIYGDGFESNDDFTEYTITNIHGIVKVKEEEM